MIDIKISPPSYDSGDMHIFTKELDRGEKIIWVGRNLEVKAPLFNTEANLFTRNMFKSLNDYYESECEKMISHETLHITLYLMEGYNACHVLDNIDKPPHESMIVGVEE